MRPLPGFSRETWGTHVLGVQAGSQAVQALMWCVLHWRQSKLAGQRQAPQQFLCKPAACPALQSSPVDRRDTGRLAAGPQYHTVPCLALGHLQPHRNHGWVGGVAFPVQPHPTSQCSPCSNQMALRLASIGDEMDLRLRSPRLAQLPGMAMHSLALTYSQTGVRGVLRNFIHGLTHLWENMRSWRLPTPSTWVFPDQVCRQLLPSVLLAVLLLGGILHLVLQ
ncbi:bcl-2-interacting killer isoform X1 [Castor canadensis]|uniref:bcl-2-interacting killer isoform X1 n=1 Tax=Castor canadensis TaxID=51338 RepID=UPI003D171838